MVAGQGQIEPGQQQRHIPVRLVAAHQQQLPAVGGGYAHVQQLHRGQFLEDHARHQAAGQGLEALAQGDGEAVGQEGDEEVRFDAFGFVMVDGPQAQVAFLSAEGFFHERQLHVATPEQLRVVGAQVGAQQIPAFALAHGAQPGAVEGVGEFSFRIHGGWHQAGRTASGPVARGAQFLQALITGEVLLLDFGQALPEGFEFAPAHGPFFGGARTALGQHIDFAVLGQELHAQLGTDFLLGFFGQFLF